MHFALLVLPLLLAAVIAEVPQLIQQQVENYQRQIQDAAIQVLTQYSEEPTHFGYSRPPLFQMPENFMRAFRPNTGVGNREDLILDEIRQVELYDDGSFSRWQYMRFNNSDYILGIGPTYAVLWQKNLYPSQPLDFAVSDGIFKYDHGPISDAVMFTHSDYRDVFYVAILTENERSSFISIYEIIDGRGMMITVIDLVRNPVVSSYTGRRLAYVQSRHGGALAVLFPSGSDVKITYQVKGSNKLNHYIKIYYPSAVNMVSFKVGEHGYLAVANGTTCDVYKMVDLERNHLLFERLYFDGEIIGLESFRLGFHRYLAVSVIDRQFLYIWKPGGFFIAQEFHSVGVRQIYNALLPNCRDDVILIFIKDTVPHEFFIWSGQYEQFIPAAIDVPANMLIWPGTVTSFSYGSSVYLLFINHHGKTDIFAIDTHLSPFQDPVLLIGKEVSDLMQQLQATMDVQAEKIKTMSATLAYAVRPAGDQRFTNMQVLTNAFVQNEVEAGSFSPLNIVWEGSTLSLAEYLKGVDDLAAQLTALEQELDRLDSILPDIVLSDEDAVITGRKLLTGAIYAPSISAQSVNIQSVGSINIPELQKQIYRLDKPVATIMGTLKFEKPLSIIGNLDSANGINQIDMNNVLTTNTEQISHAKIAFNNKLVISGDLIILEKMNGIDIGSEVVTLNGNHMVSGKKIFKGGIVSGDVVANYVDGVDIHRLYSQVMTKSGDQTFSAAKHFTGSFRTQNITLTGRINSFDIIELSNDIVRVDVPAAMYGKTFLSDLHVKNELSVSGTVNGLKIPDDLLLKTRPNTITGKKDFHNILYVDEVNVAGTVDGLNLPSDVIILSADEAIENTLYFTDGITAQQDIIVHGLVDGVDISELAKDILNSDNVQYIDTAVFTGPLQVQNNLDVRGNVNGIPLYDVVNDIVYKDDTNVVLRSRKHFMKLTAKKVDTKKLINDYNIREDFVTVQGNQTIYDTKIFRAPVTFRSITTANDVISGVNIAHLYSNRITLSVEENFSEELDFVDHLIINGDLVVHGTLDGHRFPEDFVLGSTDQEISNKMFQGTLNVGYLKVSGDINAQLFGGLQLQDFIHRRVTLSGDQVLDGDLYLGNTTAMTVDVLGNVNDIDIVDFANNVMSSTRDQTVAAFKEFSGTATVWKSMTTSNGINGIDLSEVNRRAVKLHGDNTITSPITFSDGLSFGDLSVYGFINGVNLTALDLDSVKTEGVHHITGSTTFHKGFHVEGDIISQNVNGMDLSKDILTKTTPQVITGSYTFTNLTVTGNIDVIGLVNGIDLSEAAPYFARSDRHNTIQSDLIFESLVSVTGDLDVIGLVNGLDLKHLERTAITKSGEQQITVQKILRGNITVYGNLEVSNVNGVNWSDFVQDIVRIDVPQSISGAKILNADLNVAGQLFVKGFADINIMNGIRLADFLDQAVFLNHPAQITGTKVFTSPIVISGDVNSEFINNLRLKTDVITIQCGDKNPQVITGLKTFQNLTVFGDVIVHGFVNGYNLPDVVSSTLMVYGDQVIPGYKTFQKPVTFLKNVSPVSVNGLSVSRDLVTLNTEQDIFGNMVFFDTVNVNSNLQIHGFLNGINLAEFSNEILFTNTNEVIDGEFTIDHAVAHNPVFVDGYVNGMDLDLFSREVDEFWKKRHGDIIGLGNATLYHCQMAQRLHSSLESSYYVLDSFKLHQVLNVSVDHIKVSDEYPYVQLIKEQDLVPSTNAATYQWSLDDRKFHFINEEQASILKSKTLSFAGHEISIQTSVKLRGSVLKIDDIYLPNIQRGFIDADFSIHQGVVFVFLIYDSGCETFVITSEDANKNRAQHVGSLNIKGAQSLVTFDLDGALYLAVSSDTSNNDLYEPSKIFVWINNGWELVQDIPAPVSKHVIHFVYHNYHYLVFTNSAPVQYNREPNSILVYRNIIGKEKFSLFQKIPFDNPKKIAAFEFGGLPELYLSTFNSTVVQIYLLEGEAGFQSTITINGKCISDVKSLPLYGDLYLIVGQQSGQREMHSAVIYKGQAKGSFVVSRNLNCS